MEAEAVVKIETENTAEAEAATDVSVVDDVWGDVCVEVEVSVDV